MNLYIIVIAALALAVVILFCNWLYAKSCVKFWNMMYREEQKHNDHLFSQIKRFTMLQPRSRDNTQAKTQSEEEHHD